MFYLNFCPKSFIYYYYFFLGVGVVVVVVVAESVPGALIFSVNLLCCFALRIGTFWLCVFVFF